MSVNSYAVSVVRDYLRKLDTSEFEGGYRAFDIGQLTYARWAACEILSALKLRRKDPPLTVIEEFAEKVDKYSCLNSRTTYAFSVAYDTAVDILDMFIS